MKKSGILLHISSLATEYGIGDLGPAAYRFADYLENNAHSYWQVLPLNHCGYGNSPYNPISAFAFDKFLISPELLFAEGYLSEQELSDAKLPAGNMIDVQAVIKSKGKVLELAAERMLQDTDIDQYIEANAWHLKPYLAFCIISEVQQSSEWYLWPKPYRQYSDELFLKLGQDYKDRLRILAMLQKVCEDQLTRLKSYLSQSGIALFGDIPSISAMKALKFGRIRSSLNWIRTDGDSALPVSLRMLFR
ncbi:MAG: 4-alpha-glucanotransferase [Candidatus Cloacimonetes bacterium]|nr:4-alpha-glucanotransferase [Candidatus Cloacimonadota bacterium]